MRPFCKFNKKNEKKISFFIYLCTLNVVYMGERGV